MQLNITSKKIPYLIITVFWVITMSMLVIKHYIPEGMKLTFQMAALPKELSEEQWMGAYLKGEKIGYSLRKITELEKGYKVSEVLKVRLKMMGVEKNVDTTIDAETDKTFQLYFFVFRLQSDFRMEVTGRVEGKNLVVFINTGGAMSRQTIPLKEPPYLNLFIVPEIMKKGMKPGGTISIPVIDPATLSQDSMKLEVLGKDPIMSLGKRQDAYKVKVIFKNIETLMWLTERGEILREESPLGFVLIKETKESATQSGKPSTDLIAQVSIPFNIKLPPYIGYLKIRLSGIDLKGLELHGGRQTLKGDILEIKRESLTTPFIPCEKRLPEEYLKDTPFIQSRDQAVLSLVRKIVGDEKDRLKATKLIHDWVYKNIKKTPIMSFPMATEVLRTREGDCNEHATLFTALARAARIPARIAVGLIYRDGFFYYHAWPEVYLNGWIALDPTLGQFPADASHTRLLTGDIDKQLQLAAIIGKLRIEGIEYR